MNLAIITSGFSAGSNSVQVTADVANGTALLVYDDETKDLIGTGTTTGGVANITVSPILYADQRIIAFVTTFGNDTYGAVIVTESDTETTGWKTPETVDGTPYDEYLEAGGAALPDVYDPSACRNIARDMDSISRAIDVPVTFIVKQIESLGGTIQVVIDNIEGAIGGYKTKFDSDAEGTSTSKMYSANGSYQLKVWGANQTIADAIVVTYDLVMPTASIEFGTNVIDLMVSVDFGAAGSPGQRVIMLVAHASVACEFQIDGVFGWEGGVWQTSGLAFRSNQKMIAAGEYTVRARNQAVPSEEITRQIKLTNF